MLPTLHIVANCADRKLVPVHPSRRLRTVNASKLGRKARDWWRHLIAPPAQHVPAIDLYGGSYWASVRRLPKAAESAGFRPKLWIVSAGYGLLHEADKVNAYSATFAAASPDSVARGEGDALPRSELLQLWWEELTALPLPDGRHPRSFNDLIKSNRSDRYLVVASPDYLTAISADLEQGTRSLNDPERLVIISSRTTSSTRNLTRHHVPSDARLQCSGACPPPCRHLVPPGLKGVIGPGIALAILNKVRDWSFGATTIRTRLVELIDASPALPRHNRRRMEDEDVKAFVKAELAADASASCAVLLRTLRDGGRACEQARFKQIYWQTKGSLYEA